MLIFINLHKISKNILRKEVEIKNEGKCDKISKNKKYRNDGSFIRYSHPGTIKNTAKSLLFGGTSKFATYNGGIHSSIHLNGERRESILLLVCDCQKKKKTLLRMYQNSRLCSVIHI